MYKTLKTLMLAGLLVCGPAMVGWAQDGKSLYFESGCDECHGPHGRSEDFRVPHLAGRPVEELTARGLLIQHNQNPQGAALMMRENPAMNRLNYDQLVMIARWLSSLAPQNP